MTDCWVIFLNDKLLSFTYDEQFGNLNDVPEDLREQCQIFKNIEGFTIGKDARLIVDASGNKVPEVFDLVFPPPIPPSV